MSFSYAQPQIDWLKNQQNLATGLVDSYEEDGQNYAYTYDQASAIIAFTDANEIQRAKNILNRMQALQILNGAWYQCYNAINSNLGHAGCNYYPTGDISWVLMAINFYQAKTGDKSYSQMAIKALNWLDTVRNTNPAEEKYGSLDLCRGVACNYPNAISTENNYDAYSAYYYRGILENDYSLIEKANLIKNYLIKEMWAPSPESDGPYHNVGIFWVGYKDYGWYTDPQSWGVLALGANGPNNEDFTRALEWLYTYGYGYGSTRHTQNYNPTVDGFDFWTKPTKNSIWLEGTEGVASAYYSIGDNTKGDYFHNEVKKLVSPNGGIIYSFSATDPSNIRFPDNFRHNSIASTAWYYFNEKRINPFKLNISWYDNFVKVNGTNFYLNNLNNKPFYFAGANNYYLFYKPWNQVEEVLNDAKAMNLTVLRMWGFCDGVWKEGYSFQPSPGVYDETTFQRMDKIIKEAGDRGIKLMIPLVNNWNDFGGMCKYVRWCNETIPNFNACSPHSGPGTNGAIAHDAFYTNNCIKGIYKGYIAYFLNRTNTLTGIKYKDDPTIFAWQLANEPRARSDPSGQMLYNWINEMSSYIKSIDPNHLLTTGEDGFYKNKSTQYGYAGYDGQDFISHHQIPAIDFASMHMYPWNSYYTYENMLKWIEEHSIDAHEIIKKPVTLNEFGVKGSLRDEQMKGFYKKIEDVNLNGDLFWILCHNAYPDYDGYCIYYPADSTVSIITNHSNIMNKKNDTNNFPIIEPIETIRVNETDLVTVIVNATDKDGDKLTYYINDNRYLQNNNIFTWQTQTGDHGIYYTTIYVNDGSKVNISTSFYVIVGEKINCAVPMDGMVINQNMAFCVDIYELPNGISSYTNGVTIDCRGSILIGNNAGTGLYLTFNNGAIKNCNIRNYVNGIYMSNAKFNTLINNNLNYNKNYALYVNFHSDNNSIINNSLSFTNNYVGVQFYNSNNNTIKYNEITGHDKGIYNGGEGNEFKYNNIYNNGGNFHNYANQNVSAFYNWWGTTNQAEIANKILDCKDNSQYSCVNFEPYLLSPYDGKEYFIEKINLNKGWNLISFPLNLINKTPLKSIEGNYAKIFTYNDKWMELKNKDEINESLGLWIKMLNNDNLIIEGLEFNNVTFNLNNGWNLIGYQSLNETNISNLFNNVIVYIYNNSKWRSYDSDKPSYLNTLNKFIPGYGYWIKKKP